MRIDFIIEKLLDNEAILKDENGVQLSWPKDKLPSGAKENDALTFNLSSPAEAGAEDQGLAKEILNEILNGE